MAISVVLVSIIKCLDSRVETKGQLDPENTPVLGGVPSTSTEF
jgi:capsular polysaccharide biosynthesis protein